MKLRILFNLIILFAVASFVTTSCQKDEDNDNHNTPPVLTDREKADQLFINEYLGSTLTDPEWTGNSNICEPGEVSQVSHDMVVKRVNYYRTLVGLHGDVVHNEEQNLMCQDAANIMRANNSLSHFPPQTWDCWTQEGSDAAGGSNLAWGSYEGPQAQHASNAVSGYIEDAGANNLAVGHRAWILYPQLKAIGHGSTSSTNCLMWQNNLGSMPSDMPAFISYPCEGYMPAPLVFPRWSFSIPDRNFSDAAVTMTDEAGNNIALNIIHIANGGGKPDPRIVWEPQGINTFIEEDQVITVEITGIKGALPTHHTYDVTIFQPSSSK